jgi:hypothetical protein
LHNRDRSQDFLAQAANVLSSSKDETIDARQHTRQNSHQRKLAELMRKVPHWNMASVRLVVTKMKIKN